MRKDKKREKNNPIIQMDDARKSFHARKRKADVHIIPKNTVQETYVDNLRNTKNNINIAIGPAGTGKTLLAVLRAIQMLREGEVDRIIVTRPAVSVDEQHGFLPGDLNAKMEPWTRPVMDVFEEYYSPIEILAMLEDRTIEIAPLAYMRGRAEPLNSLILTTDGYKRMGDISINDYVYGSNGEPTKVTGVFPQGTKNMADVYFNDGTVVTCSKDHLWNTRNSTQRNRQQNFTTKTTKEIQQSLVNKHGQKNHEIPTISKPVEIEYQSVPIDPYVLGCLLGDGSITQGTIQFTSADYEIISTIKQRLPEKLSIKPSSTSISGYDYYISNHNGRNEKNMLKESLRDLSLWGKYSYNKSIPELYKMNSINVRLELLRGLMDTDGSISLHRSKKSRVEYYSTSNELANDVKWLVESLGGIATIHERETPKNGTHTSGFGHSRNVFVVNIVMPSDINPFNLSRKSKLFNPSNVLRFIIDVKDAEDQECQCISVEADDHLYLTKNFVVTHNTFKHAYIVADEIQNATPEQVKMLLTRIGEGSYISVTGDLLQHDRGFEKNGLKDFIEKIGDNKTNGIAMVKFEKKHVERHPIVETVLNIYGED